ncbi:MAG: glutamate 5-kinase [Thermoplasmatota archaeon]
MAKPTRVVVKIGTNALCGALDRPDPAFMDAIADEIVALRANGHEFIVVSSGAIGAGRAVLGFKEKVRDVKLRQACAAVGQSHLMREWDRAFARHGVPVAQLLLTYHTFSSRESFLHLKDATEALLGLGVVPIVNENDTVSIEEIDASFGDNDRLSALVASKADADHLVILSDVAGLFTRPPGEPGATRVPEVHGVTPEILRMAGAKTSSKGRGGMASKLEAVKLANAAGIPVTLARGREPRVVARALAGDDIGTRFFPTEKVRGKERWLAIAKPRGVIEVDAGAAKALAAGKHLLPAGVLGVKGEFPADAVVDIAHGGKVIARALSAFSSRDLERVRRLQSADARRVLGATGAVNVTKKKNVVWLG